MKRAVFPLMAVGSLLLTSACNLNQEPTFTHKTGVSDLQFNVDVAECNLFAAGLAPSAIPVPPAPPAPPPINPQTGISQGGFQGAFVSSLNQGLYLGQLAQVVKARKRERHARITCMRLRGYEVEE